MREKDEKSKGLIIVEHKILQMNWISLKLYRISQQW